jgi:hypothetical protein
MSTSDVDGVGKVDEVLDVDDVLAAELAEEKRTGKHDPRIDKLYRQDVITIYTFVILLWITLWSVFFLVANPLITDNILRWLLIVLGVTASVFNTVGMISNTRRLKHEAVRFYGQDLYWQDEKKRRKRLGITD